jgi:3-isopropylmalate/(R)-2-methylmalate dehydratase small subunit
MKVIHVFGDDVSTDVIYPGRYMATVLPAETPQFAFADEAALNAKLKNKEAAPGSVIVAGNNFGCGSSREQGVSCLKGYELIVIARSFARIFLQNSVNLGLKTIVCPGIEARERDELDITPDRIWNIASGKSFRIEPLPSSRQAIIEAGGLISYTRKRLLELQQVAAGEALTESETYSETRR